MSVINKFFFRVLTPLTDGVPVCGENILKINGFLKVLSGHAHLLFQPAVLGKITASWILDSFTK
jgi:hypothetical protein